MDPLRYRSYSVLSPMRCDGEIASNDALNSLSDSEMPAYKGSYHDTRHYNYGKKHWWELCCLKKKLHSMRSNGTDVSHKLQLSDGNEYDQAVTCLCFTCPKCLKALEKSRNEPQECLKSLEFLTQYDF